MVDQQPKILRVGLLNTIQQLDPRTAQDAETMFVSKQLFDSPYGTKYGTTEVEPLLLDGPLRQETPTLLRGTVRDDVKFSDGSPLTAQDVVDSIRQSAVVKDHARVELDGQDLIFRLHRPNGRFALQLTHGQCGVIKRVGADLLGTGPFVYHPDSTESRIRLVRNPHHKPLAKLDEVHFVTYPVDAGGRPTALIDAVEKGEVDLTNCLGRDDINKVSGARKSILPGISTCFLHLNTQSRQLTDPRVRQAIAHSLDRLELAKICYSNALAFAASSLLPRTLGAGEDRLSHDPERAQQLIDEVGDQKPKKLRLVTVWGPRPYLPNPEAVAASLVEQIGRLGIEVEVVRPPSSSEYFRYSVAGSADLTLVGWVADTMDPVDFLEALLASYRVPSWDNLAVSANEGRLQSGRMDDLLQQWRASRDSQTLEDILDLVAEKAPLAPLFYGASATVHGFSVQNFKPSPMAHYPLTEIDIWHSDR